MKVYMIGPAVSMRGGISSAVKAYANSGFFERNDVRYLPSVFEGRGIAKLVRMIIAFLLAVGIFFRSPPSIVHIHIASGVSLWRKLCYVLASRALGHRVLLQFHSGKLASYLAELGWARRQFVLRVLRLGAMQVTVSIEIAKALTHFGLVMPTYLIKNPIVYDDVARASNGEAQSALPSYMHTHDYVLFVGRLEREKGIWDLLEAWKDVSRKFPDIILALAGEGVTDQISAYASRHGFEKQVHCLGWVSDILPAIRNATLFVLPSHFEGQPISILEAMACGTAILATDVGEIPNMITDGQSGRIVSAKSSAELRRALEELLSNSILRERLALGARARFERDFSESKAEQSLLFAYEQILEL